MVNQLVHTLGDGPAATLTKCIALDGIEQLATKADLVALEERMKARFAVSEERMKAYVEAAISKLTRTFLIVMTGFMATMVGMMVPLYVNAFG